MSNVRDDGHIVLARCNPMLRQPLGRGLEQRIVRASLDHLGEQTLHLVCGRCGRVKTRVQIAGADLRRHGIHRADAPARRREDAADEAHRGRLAISAGNADHAEPTTREAVQGRLQVCIGLPTVGHQHRGARSEFGQIPLHHARCCPGLQCLLHEAVPVYGYPADSHEQIPGLDRTRIAYHVVHLQGLPAQQRAGWQRRDQRRTWDRRHASLQPAPWCESEQEAPRAVRPGAHDS